MSELEQQIATILREELSVQRDEPTLEVYISGTDAAVRRIAALPQPITAETVRRVLDAMGGLIGSGAKPDDWLDHEAIAQRANQEDECADEHCNAKAACVNELAGIPCRVRN